MHPLWRRQTGRAVPPTTDATQRARSRLTAWLNYLYNECAAGLSTRARAHADYTKEMACAICHTRKPRRYCPGVRGEICTICCGTEREVTVDCPSDCPFLQEARKHEHTGLANPDTFPNRDIKVSEEFLEDHEDLLIATARGLTQAA